ncbi:MAG: 3-phosphoshikimate 1-carboxyvinyltransferase [Magnetococcales bacterium]|nr:3-phosphoshikimate 1-carboxyvinyltransferase [Magnetococcales bacterium]
MDKATTGRILTTRKSGALRGMARLPGDKSISHRAVILGSLARGITRVENLLEGEDVLATAAAFRRMGVVMNRPAPGRWEIHGVGLQGLAEPDDVLDMGNSGTAMRLLTGVLASQPFFSVLTGDSSLRRRPMRRVVQPLLSMGAQISGRGGGDLAPLAIRGTDLVPLEYRSPVASAQVKSAILLAGLNTPGETVVTEPALSRDHTERMLNGFGGKVERDGLTVRVMGWTDLTACELEVPGDISSAAFPLVAAILVPGSEVELRHVGVNPTRTGLLTILELMGAGIEQRNPRLLGGEPVADLLVRHAALRGIEVPPELVPAAIDEFPVLCVAAALAEGQTRIRGAEELRVKESDRIAAMAEGLRRLEVSVEELPDGLIIQGRPQGLQGDCRIDSATDHRIAMSFLVAGLVADKGLAVTRCENIATSFPGFVPLMTGLGAVFDPEVAA